MCSRKAGKDGIDRYSLPTRLSLLETLEKLGKLSPAWLCFEYIKMAWGMEKSRTEKSVIEPEHYLFRSRLLKVRDCCLLNEN